MTLRLILSCVTFVLIYFNGVAQSPFFTGNQQIRGFLNPALTGINGSLSFSALSKGQYLRRSDFNSFGVSFEQSIPCNRLDYGAYTILDYEGDSPLISLHAGSTIVYTIPFGRRNVHNIRTALKVQYNKQWIDWSKLSFSDQLDPIHGLGDGNGGLNSTAFQIPENSASWSIQYSFGFIHKVDIGRRNRWSLTWGWYFDDIIGTLRQQTPGSLLNEPLEKNRTLDKWSVYFSPEFPLYRVSNHYIGFRPTFILQQESSLTQYQIGFDLNYQRAYGIGLFLSTGGFRELVDDSKSISLNSFFRLRTSANAQSIIHIQYTDYVGGLNNVFGPTVQIGVNYIFRKNGCGTVAKGSSNDRDCYSYKVDKMVYENIWLNPGKKWK